jgi:hypothetical protein
MASDTYSLTVSGSFEGLTPPEIDPGRRSPSNARTARWVDQQRSAVRMGDGNAAAFDDAEQRFDAAYMADKLCLPGNVRGPLGLAQPILLHAPQPTAIIGPRQRSPGPTGENFAKCAEHWRNLHAACVERAAHAQKISAGLPTGATPSRRA